MMTDGWLVDYAATFSSTTISSRNWRTFRVFEVLTFWALGQRPDVLNVHSSQRGLTGKQIVCRDNQNHVLVNEMLRTWPNPTSKWLISRWYSFGSQDCKFNLKAMISSDTGRKTMTGVIPRLFGSLRWRFVPTESISDPMNMDVDTDAIVCKAALANGLNLNQWQGYYSHIPSVLKT